MNNLSAMITGGGIGGLTAALCLAKMGFEVVLFEQSAQFSEAGAGLQLSPNCSRVLHELGLANALGQVAFLPQATQFRHWRRGGIISETPLGEAVVKKFGVPYYHVHRSDLINLLANAAAAEPLITLVTGARVESFEQVDDEIVLNVSGKQYTGELLLGADGIHSCIRSQLWGDEQPTFTGNVAWRALVPASTLDAGRIRPMSTVWWGPGKHFVHYYVRGGDYVNCVCVVENREWAAESWTTPGDRSQLKADFQGWHDDIQHLIDHVESDSLFKWGLFDRPPMPRWGRGRVTLLGDACHPTLPFMAQGAAMAIEDAAVLAGCLKRGLGVEASLERYEELRRGRTARIQAGSRRNASVFHLSGVKAWLRNRAAPIASGKAMEQLYQYNALESWR